MLLNCGVGEDSWESLGLQGDPTSKFQRKSILNFHLKDWWKVEAPILWPPDVKSWLIGKDPDSGKDWGQEEKGTTENGMVGWYLQLNGHEFEQALGVCDGQESLACYIQSVGLQRVRHGWGWISTATTPTYMCTYVCLCVAREEEKTWINGMMGGYLGLVDLWFLFIFSNKPTIGYITCVTNYNNE